MSERTYTDEQLDRALSYLSGRIECENAMTIDVERQFSYYAEIIVNLLVAGAAMGEIEDVIEELIDSIYNDCLLLAVDDHESRRDSIIAFITRSLYGDSASLRERISRRCRTFLTELMVAVTVGKILDKSRQVIYGTVQSNFKHPYDNLLVKDAKALVEKGAISSEISFDPPSFGYGIPVSSERDVELMTEYAVGEGWAYFDYLEHKETAIGYYVIRGSSYPCDECDSRVGWHPIWDNASLPLFHRNCKCITIWDVTA